MTYERARSISEVLNGGISDAIGTNLRAVGTTASVLAETVVTWVNLEPTPSVWWLKSATVLALNAPLALLAIYQLARVLPKDNIETQMKVQHVRSEFDRLGPL